MENPIIKILRVPKIGSKMSIMAEAKRESAGWKNQSRRILLHHEMKKFTKAFRDNFVTLMVSSLGLLVALSWNNFWTTWVTSLMIENTVIYKFLIALAMTILAVILTYIFSRLKNNPQI